MRDSAYRYEDNIENLLPQIYHGHVDSLQTVPNDLSKYDAVLILFDPSTSSDTLSFRNQMNLIDFLKSGGRLYAEGRGFLRNDAEFELDNFPDPQDTLWHFIGLRSDLCEGVEGQIDTVYGVDSEFTKDFKVSIGSQTMGAFCTPGWDVIPVLYAPGGGPAGYEFLAWISADPSILAVMHTMIIGYGQPYYNPFLTRVLCDYFGLCTDAVQEQKSTPTSDLRVVEDGDETWLVVSGQDESELDIVNTLGETVFRSMVSAGDEKIAVPANLPSGVYFARLLRNGPSEMRPFALIQK